MTATRFRYAFGVVLAVYLLVALIMPHDNLHAGEICVMPPFVMVLTLLAWKAVLLG
jgi:hypothetical protein